MLAGGPPGTDAFDRRRDAANGVAGEDRPLQWTTRPVVVVPRGARITQVLLWWEQPDYLAVQLN